MVSAGLGLLALLALSACAWGQQMNTVTDIERPPTSCETEHDCNKGRCIHNWPEETEKEELARMLLPDFEPSEHWPVCECTRLQNRRMPKGPRCEEALDLDIRTCNSDNDCGGAKEGGRCLFREDGFGYCVCLRTRTGDRCQDSVSSERIGQQVLGPYYPGGGIYGGSNYWGYPNTLGYQTGYGLYGNGQSYYSNSGYQPWGAYRNGYYGYYGNGARYGGAYSLGYQAPYSTTYGEASAPYNNYYHSYYNNGARYGVGYQAPYYGSGARYGYGYQAPYGTQYGVGGYQAPYYGSYGATYGAGYQAPYYGYGYGTYGNRARYGGNYAFGYQAPYSGYYGNYYRGYQPNNLSYARGYQAVNQPYYQAGYQLPYNRGYVNYGAGYQGYPLYNYGAQILPRATYYQNYQLPAYQLSAYRPATFYQPYASSSNSFPWSLYALGYSTQQPSLYQPFYGGYTGGYYPGYSLGFGYPGFNYGYNYPGYNLGYTYPGYNYGATYPGYNINYRYPGFNYGYLNPGFNLGQRYNYGYGNLGYNFGYSYPRYNYGYGNLGYLGSTLYPRYNYGYNLGNAYPYLGYQFPGYYGQPVGYQPGLNYRAVGDNNPPYSLYALQLLLGSGYRPGFTTGTYPGYFGAALPGYGTPYYSGYLPQPGYGLSGVAPYSFYGGGYPGAFIGGAFAPGFSPVGGFTGYRPPIGFSTVPGTTGTVTAPGVTTVPGPATGVYGGIGPYVGGYGLGFSGAPYGFGFGPGRVLKFNKLTGTYLPSNIPYSAAMGGVGGAPVGASPVPGGNIGLALAGGGTSLVANEGKAGGWEPSLMPEFCDQNHLSGGFCQNGGLCHNNPPYGVTCSCPPGWMGRACETEKGLRGLESVTPYSFGCRCPIAVNGPNGQVVGPAGQPIAPGTCINPCVMTAADRFRFVTNGNMGANPIFNSNNQPDLFPSAEAGPAGFLQCGDRNHRAGNCHIKPCAPGTIFSFGAQVCTTDDIGVNTPTVVVGGPTPVVGGPTPAVGSTFPGALFPGYLSGVNRPAVGALPIPYKKK